MESRPTILVVDDDPAIRELLKLQLSAAGYEVALAGDALAARRFLRLASADLMIVDAHLPDVSGVEFVSTLIDDPALPWVPVIFITGRQDLLERAEALGSACLVKPFLDARLIELVERVLRSQARAALEPKAALNAA
jgi:DNA-binding response OmpR family regulator